MKKICILGANGYIGYNLFQALSSESSSNAIYAIGRGCRPDKFGRYSAELELNTLDALHKIRSISPDIIIDCISYVRPNAVRLSRGDVKECLEPFEMLIKSLDSGCRYIFISSGGTVYGPSHKLCAEADVLDPQTPYALQKCLQENIVKSRHDIDSYILRVTNPYGSGQKVKNSVGFVAQALKSAIEDSTLKLFVPSETVRDYIYMKDLLIYLKGAIFKEYPSGIYNISTGTGISLKEVVDTISAVMEKEIKVDFSGENNVMDGYIPKNVVDNTKVISNYSESPRYDFKRGVKEMVREMLVLES